jgi:hypothetical protein
MEYKQISMGRWIGSLLLFTVVVSLGVLLINDTKKSVDMPVVATTTPVVIIAELPDVAPPAEIKTDTIKKTAFPVGKMNLAEAEGTYPANTPFAKNAKAHVNEFISGFMNDYAKRSDIVTSSGVSAESSATFSYGKKLFSYLYTDWRDDGGAHGNAVFSSETLDMNGKKYELRDLFLPNEDYLGVLSRMAIVYFAKDPNINFDPQDQTFGTGLDPKPENFATFFISGDKIIFQFQNYQIGPYSDGAQQFEVFVNYSELKEIIKAELF